jgi:hypothetical protein
MLYLFASYTHVLEGAIVDRRDVGESFSLSKECFTKLFLVPPT